MDHAGRDVYETGFRDHQFFLLALGTQVKPDLGIELIHFGRIGILECQKLVEIMGMGIVNHKKGFCDAEPVHTVAGIPFFAPDVERWGCKLWIKLGKIGYGLAFIILGVFFGNHSLLLI